MIAAAVLLMATSVGAGWGMTALPARAAITASTTSGFHAVTPTRIMDTRVGLGGSRFGPGESRVLQVTGHGELPAAGGVAVSLNVTVTGPTAAGFLTVWPAGSPLPATSNLNFAAGEVRANAVVTGVDAGGRISLFNGLGQTDVVVDVTGWFSGDFVGLTPSRLLDTRTTTPLQPGEVRDLVVGGRGGVPAGATAVAVTVTITSPTAVGYVSVWPGGSPWPGTSSVNFSPGDTIASTALVGLGAGGDISLKNSSGTTQVIVDVMGWFSGGLVAGSPSRVFDTRTLTGNCGVHLNAFEARTIHVTGQAGVPVVNVGAVVFNVTVTDPDTAGYLTVWPAGAAQPLASSVNYVPGETVANAALIGVGAAGEVSIFNGGGPTDVVIDVTGYFPGETPGGTPAPCPPATVDTSAPLPGRRLADGTIAVSAFNATLDALGGGSVVAHAPAQLALALTADSSDPAHPEARTLSVRSTPEGEADVPYDVVVEADGFLDDSLAGIHYEVRLVPHPDGTFRVDRATWGYMCARRPSPPFSTVLCP